MVLLLALVIFAQTADIRAQRRSVAAWSQATCEKTATIGDLKWQLSGNELSVTIVSEAQAIVDIPDDFVFEMEQECRDSVTSLTLSQIKNIGAHAFDSFRSLEEVKVGNDCLVQSIGDFAFANTLVQSLNWSHLVTVGTSAFDGCGSLALFSAAKLATIGDRAFAGTSFAGLQSLTVSLTSIGSEAFLGSKLSFFPLETSCRRLVRGRSLELRL